MDIQERQMESGDQALVLRTLAESVARPSLVFLEVGTWCGDTAILLGKVARTCGGKLFCVDWWRGSPGTRLSDIAQQEDIFSVFWRRIHAEGLEETVVPIRGRSDEAVQVLRAASCDLVFLDGDHRYAGIRLDIEKYAPLVRRGGILCGHDCEGRTSDFDPEFLFAGKDEDFHQSVHCGVVLAVGQRFPDCTIQHGVWSVRAVKKGEWEPAAVPVPGLPERRQAPVPPLGSTRTHSVYRYGSAVYAVPHDLDLDIRDEAARSHPQVLSAAEPEAIEARLGQTPTPMPVLLETYRGFNLVAYGGRVLAAAIALGPLDLTRLDDAVLETHRKTGQFGLGRSVEEARAAVDRLELEALQKSSAAGAAELARLRADLLARDGRLAALEDEVRERRAAVERFQAEAARRAAALEALGKEAAREKEALEEARARCATLEGALLERDSRSGDLEEARRRIAALEGTVSAKEAFARELTSLRSERDEASRALAVERAEVASLRAEVASLSEAAARQEARGEQIRADAAAREGRLDAANRAVQETAVRAEALAAALTIEEASRIRIEKAAAALERKIAERDGAVEGLILETGELRKRKGFLTRTLAARDAQVANLEEDLAGRDRSLEALRREVKEKAAAASELQSALAAARAEAAATAAALEERLRTEGERTADLERALAEGAALRAELEASVRAAEEEVADFSRRFIEEKAAGELLGKKLAGKAAEAEALKRELIERTLEVELHRLGAATRARGSGAPAAAPEGARSVVARPAGGGSTVEKR